jgi:hypothetical protein
MGAGRRPNMRVQRTRSSPSALRSPLTRHPLGSGIWLMALAAFIPVSALAGSPTAPACAGFDAGLEAINTIVPAGTVPRFRLTLRNRATTPLIVLDVRDGRRPDLQAVYFELEVLSAETVVDLPRAICDPGPVSDSDFFSIKAGQTEQLLLSESCLDFHQVKPGPYRARVLLWLDPYASAQTRCRSEDASFTVQK